MKNRDFRNNHNRRIKYQIFGIVFLCFMLIIAFSNFTIAWLMDDSTTSNSDDILLIGTLDLEVTSNFKIKNLALAPDTVYTLDMNGKDIGTYLKTTTSHDIDGAYVRVKFTTERKLNGTTTYVDNSDVLSLYFEDNITTSTTYNSSSENKWFYNASDGYYYYLGGVYGTNIVFNKGYKTSNIINNTLADANVRVTFSFDTIQRQYGATVANWTTAPEVFLDMVEAESGTISNT